MIHTFHASGLFFCEMSLLCTSDATLRGFFPWPSSPVLFGWKRRAGGGAGPHICTPEGDSSASVSAASDLQEVLSDTSRVVLSAAGLRVVEALGVTVDMAFEATTTTTNQPTSRGCGRPERHPAPFIGHIVSQMFRMHRALSARMFDGLAAKGDIW